MGAGILQPAGSSLSAPGTRAPHSPDPLYIVSDTRHGIRLFPGLFQTLGAEAEKFTFCEDPSGGKANMSFATNTWSCRELLYCTLNGGNSRTHLGLDTRWRRVSVSSSRKIFNSQKVVCFFFFFSISKLISKIENTFSATSTEGESSRCNQHGTGYTHLIRPSALPLPDPSRYPPKPISVRRSTITRPRNGPINPKRASADTTSRKTVVSMHVRHGG